MENYDEVTRSALTLAYQMGLIPIESPLWTAVDYGHLNANRWGEWWDSGELREALEVLREVDNDSGEDNSEEINRVVGELAALDAEGADIYGGEWFRGEVVMYTEKGVEEYIQDYYDEVYEGLEHLLYYVDYKAMARDSILSGDWQMIGRSSQTYYVAN